jgi:putative tricarboxylic transport membrane protein
MGDETQFRRDVAASLLAQRGAALVFALICVGFVWQARSYPYLDDTGPGAGFFAMWIGGLGLLVGIAMVAAPQAGEADSGEPMRPGAGRAILVTLVVLAAAAFALEPLGFRPTAFLLLTVLLRAYAGRWISALLFGAITSFLVFQVFEALRLRLPVGVFGI